MAFSVSGDLLGYLSHKKNLRTAKMKLHSLLKKLYLPGWQSKTLNSTAREAPPTPPVKPEFCILHVWLCTHTHTTLKLWGVLKRQLGPFSGCLDLYLMSGQGKQTYGFTARVVTQSFGSAFQILLIRSSRFPWHWLFQIPPSLSPRW